MRDIDFANIGEKSYDSDQEIDKTARSWPSDEFNSSKPPTNPTSPHHYIMDTLNPDDLSRFDEFIILTTTYKTVHDHELTVDVLYPKSLDEQSHQQPRSKPRPTILRYHGGGLVGGSSLYAPFFNPWYLELAKENLAIIVSPNYRLLPESSVTDILEDVEDHWQWTHRAMPQSLEETAGTLQADLSRIMTVGDSAGGYLSLQMGLDHASEIRAVNAVYPVVDFKTPQFCNGEERPVFNMPPFPRNNLERHMEDVKKQQALKSR
jgi:acetyl esterase/lipase